MESSFVSSEEIGKMIPKRIKDSHKGTYGRVALLGGNTEYSGAIRLATYAMAALRSGCGVATVAIPKHLVDIVSKDILEQIIYPITDDGNEITFDKTNIDGLINGKEVLTIGMGLGKSDGARKIVRYILDNYKGKLIIDADAINIIAEDIKVLDNVDAKMVFTPHMMEFTRLLNSEGLAHYDVSDVENDKENLAVGFAKRHNIVLLLKGPVTIITDGTNVSRVNRGTPGMSTAGSGDVLSGILTGFLGYMEDTFDASIVSAYINGLAGELAAKKHGEISMIASDTVDEIANAVKQIEVKLY